MGRITLTPLTAEEQVFAAEHHNLVYRYLHIRKLPIEKWYDAVIFSYLQAVKKWFVRPEIQTYQFSTIACNSMRAAIGNEQKRQARQIQTISLDEGIAGAEDLTYSDTITSENLRYIPYITCNDGRRPANCACKGIRRSRSLFCKGGTSMNAPEFHDPNETANATYEERYEQEEE